MAAGEDLDAGEAVETAVCLCNEVLEVIAVEIT
jgi:hypothetical protein